MIFNSLEYLFFFGAVVGLHFALPQRLRWMLLLAASYLFYMRWNPAYILLIIASTAIDYAVGLRLARAQDVSTRRMLVGLSLTANLGLLFTFKYWDFFWQSLASVAFDGHRQ